MGNEDRVREVGIECIKQVRGCVINSSIRAGSKMNWSRFSEWGLEVSQEHQEGLAVLKHPRKSFPGVKVHVSTLD